MRSKPSGANGRSLAIGLAAGAGAVIAANILGRNPERQIEQILVNRAFDRAYGQIARENVISLEGSHRYVIFSDHHKGTRNGADDFRFCEQTYLKALDYYHQNGSTLVILGDAEELLEENISAVMRAYENIFRSEARFHPERLIRIYGNHDIAWKSPALVKRYMDPFFPGIRFREGLLFRILEGEAEAGQVLLIHGFQGSLDSDWFAFLAKWVLPFYRDFQVRTGLGATSPSRDACLRSTVDNRLYRWSSRQGKLIMVCGHTHRPVWSSKTLLDKLTEELYALLRLKPEEQSPEHAALVKQKKIQVEERRMKYPACNDVVKTRPSYFNDGCCRYSDGDITGIEIENGVIRLVKWSPDEACTQPVILEENDLRELFLFL